MPQKPIHTQSDFEKLLAECKEAVGKMTWKKTPVITHESITESYDGEHDVEAGDDGDGKKKKMWRCTVCAWRDEPHFGVDAGCSDIANMLMVKLPRDLALFAMEKAKDFMKNAEGK